VEFRLDGDLVDVDTVSKVEIQDVDQHIIETIDTIVHVSLGRYRVTVPALLQAGTLFDVWSYTPVEDADVLTVTNTVVVADIEGDQGETPTPPDTTPDAGTDAVCLVTALFRDASGNGFQGVHVRFTPNVLSDQNAANSFIVRDVDAQSDEDGEFQMYLLRGMRGTISVSGLGLVREVEIPDVATIQLFDLVGATQDLLEVQKLDFVKLVRHSL
jgi:hypothetical protein